MTKKELWSMKKEALMELADKYEIKYNADSMNRKEVIDTLIIKLAEDGELTEAAILSDDEKNTSTKGKRWAIVRIHSKENQPKYQYLGLGSRDLYLPRDVPCKIPAEFLNLLQSAAEERLEMQQAPGGKIKYITKRVPAVSYEVLETGVG